MSTHEVLNQPPPLENYDPLAWDPALTSELERLVPDHTAQEVRAFSARVGSEDVMRWGFEANEHTPVLHTHDRFGNRVDRVEYHPAYHSLMDLSVGHGLQGRQYATGPGSGERLVRDMMFTVISQIEAGHGCPISMTSSVLAAMAVQPDLADEWRPRIVSRRYDPRFLPAGDKDGALLGMGMTEKQGGSDVRANTSVAVPADGGFRLTGHKWFTSAPMCDAFLVLANEPAGLSCYLLPRFQPDGTVNHLSILRLKDKLGNRSNASSEIEFENAFAWPVGEPGRGVHTIIEMVNGTRLDCVLGSTGLMRQAVTQAVWHSMHRAAFGAELIDQPLMQNVLADLEVEVEAATLLATRVSQAFDRAEIDPTEEAFRRIATPVAKYWVTKRCSETVREAMECLGGNGYVEESILPRLYRESPVNAIWEGSGNVIALDVLRALARSPGSARAFVEELDLARGRHPSYDRAIDDLVLESTEAGARRLVERMAVLLAASLLIRFGDEAVTDAYLSSRVENDHGGLFGTLDPTLPVGALARRPIAS